MNYIEENNKRRARHKAEEENYDPITGFGCVGVKRKLELSDAPYTVYLPIQMFDELPLKELCKHKSIESFYNKNKMEFNSDELQRFWVDFCELRYKFDYEFYAICTQTILHKEKGKLVPFRLNPPQRDILTEFETERLSSNPLRFNILKSRQFGSSTFIANYFEYIQVVHMTFWNSVICAHVQDPAKRIREMYERSIRTKPPIDDVKITIGGFQGSQNIRQIPERGCTITVGTAMEPDSVRSDAVKLAHFSEIAFYPETDNNNAEKIEAGITSSIPEIPLTAIIRESTANGQDYFFTQYQKAKAGEVGFKNIFIPWHRMSEYSKDFEGTYTIHNGRQRNGDVNDFIKSLNDYEKVLFANSSCTLEHLNWYRAKAGTMPSISLMRQEYPSDDIEAFRFSGMPVLKSEHIELQRKNTCLPEFIGNIVSDCPAAMWSTDPQRRKSILTGLRFEADRDSLTDLREGSTAIKARAIRDKLQVWQLPEKTAYSNRYVVTFDPQKGLSESADFAVITVIDRYWRMFGGGDEKVAQWRGRLDKDIEIWIAAQIAKFYNNALLVVESNTYDQDSGQVDESEYIFSIIADYYDNLYRREIKDKLKGEIVLKFGFITNKQTKTTAIENYRTMLRTEGYTERDSMTLDEARVYEQDKRGRFNAKKGYHDDILMSTMIGLYVSSQIPMPKKIERKQTVTNYNSGYSTI